ncbi:MAG: type II toxin-antitoxin system RelE family toxin [Blastococcus sp.]
MARYRVELLPAAVRALRRLDRPVRVRVAAAIDALADEPRPPGAKALTGMPGLLRIRVGDYRIIYDVIDAELLVEVITLGHRREVYRQP